MKKNDGTAAERAFEKHWKGKGHCERLRDKKDLMGLNNNMRVADFAKPSDFIVSARDVPLHYAEVKSTVGKTFRFSDIRPAQSAAALKEARWGNGSYFFYIFSIALGQWFIMSCHQYDSLLEDGRRSVTFEELEPWQK